MISKLALACLAYVSIVASAMAYDVSSAKDGLEAQSSANSVGVEVAINPQPLPPSDDD